MAKELLLTNEWVEIKQGTITDEQTVSLFLALRTNSVYTFRNYQRAIAHFREFISYKPLREVTWKDIELYQYHLSKGTYSKRNMPYAPATVASLLAPLRSFFKWGSDPNVKLFSHDPTTSIRAPKVAITSKHHYLTQRETVLLLNQLKHQGGRDYLVGLSLVLLGLRVSELTAMRWTDFHTDPAESSIWLSVERGKGNKQRDVKVPQKLWRLYKEYAALYEPKDPLDHVFPLSVRQVERIIRTARENCQIGKKVTPHWLRHTNATLALLHGASLQQVQENLGHAHITTTQRYLHTVEQLQKAAPDYVENCLQDALRL
ncbi:tyrosine-type recombinase/integrase [Brevibacillus ruminantium]|uniref:Tyrosine-type recombinase/integrase n=1 Tax=Brevibacillus ruminantium TaxID=2950604 RepID=A0ABY4WK11_9BACL|nr:tyrosine-type recombinase/integrase [Brevibacillus ruminantium]USG64991.1 tyrosine-type recombinase/integrase [Brevibacillus ruminantium]